MMKSRIPAVFMFMLLGRALQLGGAFAVSIVIVLLFGLDGAGTYALAALPSAFAAQLVTFGLPSGLPHLPFTNQQRATVGLIVSLMAFVPVCFVAVLFGMAFGHSFDEVLAITTFGLGGGFFGQMNVQQSLYVLQKRTAFTALTPAIHLAGILVALDQTSIGRFGIVLLASRAVGSIAGWTPLQFARVPMRDVKRSVIEGAHFLPLDVAALLGEMLPTVVLATLLTRAELGLFGIARQFVTVADTPGWTYIFSKYPSLVADIGKFGSPTALRNERLSWLAAVGCLVAACTATVAFYRTPALLPALPLIMLPLPGRYMNNFCDQALRATGHIRDCASLAISKIAVSLVTFGLLAWLGGFWGAIAASAILSWSFGVVYRRRLLARFPRMLRPFRPWRFA